MTIDPRDLSVRDEVVVETEIDGASVGLAAFITNVLENELWLATRLPDERLAGLKDGQVVHLAFDRGGALIVESAFLRRLGSGTRLGLQKSRIFSVKRPLGVENVQRRAHVRVDLERLVRIRSLGTLGSDKMGTGKTVNIGAGGVQFATEMPLMFGQQLRLALVLSSKEIVVAGGPIVRIEDHGEPVTDGVSLKKLPTTTSLVAVRFDQITEVDRERVAVHVLSAHRRRRSAPPSAITDVADAAEPAGQAPVVETPPEPALTPPTDESATAAG